MDDDAKALCTLSIVIVVVLSMAVAHSWLRWQELIK